MSIINDMAVDGAIEEIDLVSVTESGVETIRQEYPGIEIETNLPRSATIEGGPTLERAVIEILENAIEHDNRLPEAREITVDLRRTNGHVELAIADDGPTIPQHELEALRSGTVARS